MRPRAGGPAAPQTHPAGDSDCRYKRDIQAAPPPPPPNTTTTRPPATPLHRPAAAEERSVARRATARIDTDRTPGARPNASLPLRRPGRRSRSRAAHVAFGKFHGHTLGQIAAFEPSYIDWVATDRHPRPGPRGRARDPGGPRSRGVVAGRTPRRSARAAPPGATTPPRNARSPPDTGGRSGAMMSDKRCRPDGLPGLVAEEPVTRLVTGIGILPNLLETGPFPDP